MLRWNLLRTEKKLKHVKVAGQVCVCKNDVRI